MKICEILRGTIIHEDDQPQLPGSAGLTTNTTPASQPASINPMASGSSNSAGLISQFLNSPAPMNPQTARGPAGFGPTAPGYSKDAAGNWTNPQGRAPDQMIKVGQGVTVPGWEVPQSAAEKAAFQQNVHNADQAYPTRDDMSGWNKLIGWDENAALDAARSMMNQPRGRR